MIRILTVTDNNHALAGCHLMTTDILSPVIERSTFLATREEISDTENYLLWLHKYGDRLYDIMNTKTENNDALNAAILAGQTEQRKLTEEEIVAFGL